MGTTISDAESAETRLSRTLCALLFVVSLGFWGIVFSRSVLALDDMSLIVRGRDLASPGAVVDMLRFDVFEQNGRIADSVLSLTAAVGGESLVRAYLALAMALLFPAALIWLEALVPPAASAALPAYALPIVAATAPFLLLALDRRLISQLVLFGAASSGYCTGLFLITLGLVPMLRAVRGGATSPAVVALFAIPLFVGVMFHEVLAALILGAMGGAVIAAAGSVDRRCALAPLVALMLVAVASKASTPGLWSRTADTDQRQLADAALLDRTDVAVAFALVAFAPLLAFIVVSLVLSLPTRGVPMRLIVLLVVAGAGVVSIALGYRLLDGYQLPGVVSIAMVVLIVLIAMSMRSAGVASMELVALGATLAALGVPVYGGLLPGRAWFFGEFLGLLVALSWLARAAVTVQPPADARVDLPGNASLRRPAFLALGLLGAGTVVAPALAYEMLDKVNDNFAWRTYVEAQVGNQATGTVEIPYTYPWNDMRPSFALDDDHEAYEGVTRQFFGISDDADVVWIESMSWATD